MRIALIAGIYESIPPGGYGGIERVIFALLTALAAMEHDVTLYATGDSTVVANSRLISFFPNAVRDMTSAAHVMHVGEVIEHALEENYDVVHIHADVAIPFAHLFRGRCPVVVTLHNGVTQGINTVLYQRYLAKEDPNVHFVCISDHELGKANRFGAARNISRIYNPVDISEFSFSNRGKGYLAFMGRFSPTKGLRTAIRVSKATGIPLHIGAKPPTPGTDEEEYYQSLSNEIDQRHIRWLGEISGDERSDFLGNANAFILPIEWDEPFGLVFVESLACGTPILTFRRGAAPEIVENGVHGFLTRTPDEMIASVGRIGEIDRSACRQRATDFSAEVAGRNYLMLYQRLTGEQQYPISDSGNEGTGTGLGLN